MFSEKLFHLVVRNRRRVAPETREEPFITDDIAVRVAEDVQKLAEHYQFYLHPVSRPGLRRRPEYKPL